MTLPVAPAQNIIKTPYVPTPDSALRHKPSQPSLDDSSYFPPLNETPVGPSKEILKNLENSRSWTESDDSTQDKTKVAAASLPAPPAIPQAPPLSTPAPEVEQPPPASEPATPSLAVAEPIANKKLVALEKAPSLQRSLSVLSVASSVAVTSPSDKETWDRTLARVINGVVSIKATTTRPFDTESAGDYNATGFVISKEHGLILSNRHVVNPAPITSVAVFVNYEEIPIWPVYRDPIHDFGIFRYDPEKLKHIKVEEIELHPDAAHVGADIRVVGNDAGEKLSILGSTLARLDRHAPSYGVDSYNDFNTFYMQAASGTSGGSSGSPVLNIQGHAVALNAGGSNSSQSSFYLPLHRVVRAVEKIKKGEHVSRGTLQTEFLFKSYDELQRLGMDAKLEEECRARFPNASGLLSVIRVLRGGPASASRPDSDKHTGITVDGCTRVPGLEPGDILFSCNGKHLTGFVELWEIIDESVGEEITLEFFRAGKDGGASGMCQVVCRVQDLHSITPSRFLEIGGSTFHDMSYQVARSHNCELGTGVFCAASGFLLWSSWSRDFLLTAVDGKPTKTLDQFIEVIRALPDRKRVPVMTRPLGKTDEHIMMVDIDRHFFLAAVFERDDVAGTWNRKELGPPPAAEPEEVKPASPASEPEEDEDDPDALALDKIKSALVNVVCRLPYSVYGYTSASNFSGVGLIVSVDPIPLIVFDRTAVPTEMLDIRLTVSNKSFPGRVVYLGAFALVTFDRHILPQDVTVPTWDEVPLKVRDEVRVVGLTSDQLLVTKDSTICSIGMNFNTKQCNPPRHRLINAENINVLEAPSCWGGVIARKPSGPSDTLKVSAFYMAVSSQNRGGDDVCWTQGLDIQRYIMPVVKKIQAGVESGNPQPVEPSTRDLGIEFADMSLSTVSTMGLSEQRFKGFVKAAKKFRGNPRPLVVETRLRPLPPGADEEETLKIADIVLEIEGKPIYRVSELTDLRLEDKETVEVIVLRGRKEVKLTIPTVRSWPSSSNTIVQFFGAILHATHSAALEQVAPTATLVPQNTPGVYVGGVSYGSPALDNIRPTHWILEIDGTPVDSIEDVLALVKEKRWQQGEYVRVKQVSRKGITSLVSVKVDERFWPTLCWIKDAENAKEGFGWRQERWSGEEFVEPFDEA
ncbi:hypothetical protein FN846DRAFT_784947 [Sphaerosporella brunnea]|uniref:Pro-apoptotic serine protease NMA111 n=1 Tax=Sphaerosporella brunnea TaxID=1250544 RepID=A0A5J5EKB7_9PEZI|nr:hypothetical protein FN846DRAFT_784947 [Sphaerosporella brunnea]